MNAGKICPACGSEHKEVRYFAQNAVRFLMQKNLKIKICMQSRKLKLSGF